MLKAVFILGLTMMAGSGTVAYDFNRQMHKDPGQEMDLAVYVAGVQGRVVNLMERDKRADVRQASLPQVRRSMVVASFDAAPRDTRAQIDDFVSGSPQLQAMVKADRAAAKQSWWARIRHKVSGPEKQGDANRLADIRNRNFPTPKQGIDPSALAGMNPMDLYANQAAISQGLSTTAANNMSDMVKSMKDAGVDMSVYQSPGF